MRRSLIAAVVGALNQAYAVDDIVVPGSGSLITNARIPKLGGGFHLLDCDIYAPSVYYKGQVVLHGGGGNKNHLARDLKLMNGVDATVDNVNWELLSKLKTVFVIPSGKACDGVVGPWNPNGVKTPFAKAWSNWDLWSGYDDPSFLRDVSAYLTAEYGLMPKDVGLSGHSTGGIMTTRTWIERPDDFGVYASSAGPASVYHKLNPPKLPTANKPYLGVYGYFDNQLNGNALVGPYWEAELWKNGDTNQTKAFVYQPPTRLGAFEFFKLSAPWRGEVAPSVSDYVERPAQTGSYKEWRYPSGEVRLRLYSDATHSLETAQAVHGKLWVETVDELIEEFR